MWLLLHVGASAHVPALGPFPHNCAHAHSGDHTLSQVAYFQGSGGLELALKSEGEPVDTENGEQIDFDVILRDHVDLSTFAVYVGCGGCMKGDEPSAPVLSGLQAQRAGIEPFTQTVTRSVVPEAKRKFDSRALNGTACPQRHFVVRLHDFGNRSDGRPLVWSAVLGRREQFSLLELASFPYYIAALHGHRWSGMGWTLPVVILLIAPLALMLWRALRAAARLPVLSSTPVRVRVDGRAPRIVLRFVDPREVVLDLAILAFVASALERLLHGLVAQYYTPLGWGLVVVVGLVLYADAFPILVVSTTWVALRHSRDRAAQEAMAESSPRWHEFYMAVSRPGYAALEISFALFVLLFGFGAGFYAGAVLIAVDAVLRTTENSSALIDTSTERVYGPVPRDATLVVPGIPVLPGGKP